MTTSPSDAASAAHSATSTHTIWDLPIRLYHWLMVALVVLQFGTAEFGWLSMQWHFWFGYALLALLIFRIAWAFVGSENVRLRRLLSGPKTIFNYLRHWRQTPVARHSGHNPLGGWSTLIMVSVLMLQALSGLATHDDIEWYGPLSERLPAAWIDAANWLHHRLPNVLWLLVAVHVLAIIQYALFKRENLVASMLHGKRDIDVAAPRLASNARALIVLAISVGAVAALLVWAE